ncbi:hypothetical protein [Bartonella tribocorum]|uniref:Hypothetica protein n=1 Tax=Bartonella tribocorum (strain DSM 28219 / CCUG 45778 / CIP 105476 / IBS 506) TaxID=382640 RepID=A9ITH8_BART1|nr:hypothetical protein [Bartonella tribocorum]CAK01430.1 hypothetica protein [Bartonella tribocorum CIP 105476]CDO48661.1 hypothetical protein BM1374166_00978 [Bartonella tribocorum]
MKHILKLLSGIVLVSVTGCNIDKPPLGEIATWEKNGVTDFTEVGKALLECGMPTPYDRDPESRKLSYNAIATIEACMIQSGFRDKVGGGTWCENHKAENLPICRLGAVVPRPSVKKRLNSPFCKKHPEQYECYP